MPERQSPRSAGARLVGLPLALLISPLFFHSSARPVFAGYSADYLALLGAALSTCVISTWWIGRRCARSESRRPAFAFLGILLGVCGSLAVAELVLRRSRFNDTFVDLGRSGHERSVLLGFEARRGHRWEVSGVRFSTNERGFRTRPASDIHWDEPGTRIAVVGASSAFGFGLNDDETWPHLLETKLRTAGSSVEVVNAANQGHNSFQTLVRTYLRVLPLAPQWVVYYQSRNDFESYILPPTGAFIPEEAAPWTTSAYLSQRYPEYTPYLKLLVVYSTIRVLQNELGGRDLYPVKPPASGAISAAEAIRGNGASYIRNVRTLADACRRQGAKLVLVTFLFDSDRGRGPLRRALLFYNELLRELGREDGIELIDLEREFASVDDKRSYFFEDAYHPSARGAEYIAERLAVHFQRLLARAE